MGAPRFFVDGIAFAGDRRQRDRAARRRRASRVARAAACAGRRDHALRRQRAANIAATIERAAKRDAWVRIGRFDAVERESALAVTLAQAIAATDTMDAIVRHAVELGASAIQPVVTRAQRAISFRRARRQAARALAADGRSGMRAVRPQPRAAVHDLCRWPSGCRTRARGVVFDAGAQASLASLPRRPRLSTCSSGPKAGSPIARSRTRCARACTPRASVRVSFAPTRPRWRRSPPSILWGDFR